MTTEKHSLIVQLGQLLGILIPMMLGFIWLDSNHEQARAGELALTRAMLYTEELEVKSLTSVLDMYDAKEQAGVLTEGERTRRTVVIRQRGERQAEVNRLKGLESDILNSGK